MIHMFVLYNPVTCGMMKVQGKDFPGVFCWWCSGGM